MNSLTVPTRGICRGIGLATSLALAGCASSPLELDGRAVSGTGPAHVLEDSGHIGDTVVWGGEILEVRNLEDHTELVVASYPLDRADRPRLKRNAGVRFVLEHPGFLEPAAFRPGRFVSVLGRVEGLDERRVGDYPYKHPVMSAEDLYLWPADTREWDRGPRFGVGIGISL